jgi:hypothetical protein
MKTAISLLISGLLFATTMLRAQPAGAEEGRPGEEARPLERLEQLKKVRLIEVLDLKEEQSVRFFARFNEHESRKRELAKAKDEVLDRLERLVRNHADAKEIEKMFPEVAAANAKLVGEGAQFFDSTSDILSAEQRAKLLLFERHFNRELREAMREAQRRRHRGDEP